MGHSLVAHIDEELAQGLNTTQILTDFPPKISISAVHKISSAEKRGVVSSTQGQYPVLKFIIAKSSSLSML